MLRLTGGQYANSQQYGMSKKVPVYAIDQKRNWGVGHDRRSGAGRERFPSRKCENAGPGESKDTRIFQKNVNNPCPVRGTKASDGMQALKKWGPPLFPTGSQKRAKAVSAREKVGTQIEGDTKKSRNRGTTRGRRGVLNSSVNNTRKAGRPTTVVVGPGWAQQIPCYRPEISELKGDVMHMILRASKRQHILLPGGCQRERWGEGGEFAEEPKTGCRCWKIKTGEVDKCGALNGGTLRVGFWTRFGLNQDAGQLPGAKTSLSERSERCQRNCRSSVQRGPTGSLQKSLEGITLENLKNKKTAKKKREKKRKARRARGLSSPAPIGYKKKNRQNLGSSRQQGR